MKDEIKYRVCSYDEILPLKGRDAKYCGFQYGNTAIYIGAFVENKIIGVCGYIIKKDKIEFVNDVVSLDYRNKGIYSILWKERQCRIKNIPHKKEYAYSTKMSIDKYIKE